MIANKRNHPYCQGEIETPPTSRSTTPTPLSERVSATRVPRHTPPTLPLNIPIHTRHPTIHLIEQRSTTTPHHLLTPFLHRLLRRLDISIVIILTVSQKLADDQHGMLDAPRRIPKGLMRSENYERVGYGGRREI